MTKQYSIVEARDHLPALVHAVERGEPAELTRRGKPVAVIVSIQDYERLSGKRKSSWEATEEWRRSVDLEALNFDPDEFLRDIRDKSPGRDFRIYLKTDRRWSRRYHNRMQASLIKPR